MSRETLPSASNNCLTGECGHRGHSVPGKPQVTAALRVTPGETNQEPLPLHWTQPKLPTRRIRSRGNGCCFNSLSLGGFGPRKWTRYAKPLLTSHATRLHLLSVQGFLLAEGRKETRRLTRCRTYTMQKWQPANQDQWKMEYKSSCLLPWEGLLEDG